MSIADVYNVIFIHCFAYLQRLAAEFSSGGMEINMIFRDETITDEIEEKAQILVDALPYIRDFNQKIVIVCFEGSNILTDEEEKVVMRDVALLKTIGMRPILVHDSRMGHDKFRENKLVAKMIEMSGVKAVGICGIDLQTIMLNVDNDYIPVITPNDIDNEDTPISPALCAAQVAEAVHAEKLIFLGGIDGIHDRKSSELISQILLDDFIEMVKNDDQADVLLAERERYAIELIQAGIPRVHFLDVKIRHSLLLELFSIIGVGTAILPDGGHYYPHEIRNGKLIAPAAQG